MSAPTSKSDLISAMISARSELDSRLQRVPRARMTQTASPGEWSIKDMVAHINSYDRWLALGLALRSEKPPDSWIADVPLDDFNRRLYEENRDLPLEQVLEESRRLWGDILEETQAKPEEYLFSEQTVHGVPDSFRPCDVLKSESFGHYLDHVLALQAWLEANQ